MLRWNALVLSIATIGFSVPLVLIGDRIAQAQNLLNRFTPSQLERINRDVTRGNFPDFFQQGRAQFEQEIRLLERSRNRKLPANRERLLKVDPKTRYRDNQTPRSLDELRSNPRQR